MPAPVAVPTHGPDEEAPDPDPAKLWAHLRRQVGWRATRANQSHMVEADQAYGTSRALGPHGILWFFVSKAAAEPFGLRLHMAHRLWYSSPDADNLPTLLAELAKVAERNIANADAAGQRWHPLGPDAAMANGGEVTLPSSASYLGVGVTTLDTADGRWYRLAAGLRMPSPTGYRSVYDLKGHCYVLLTDGTALRIDRDPHRRLGDDGIRSSKPLDADRAHWHNPYADLTEQGEYGTREVWRRLAGLHYILASHLGEGQAP
ncbi:hypothetical protein ACFFMR_26145 [Micromonospora andamanensis]